MIDILPAWLRHWLLISGPFAAALFTSPITGASRSGIVNISWGADGLYVLLWLTPLTRQYGVGRPAPLPTPGVMP